MIYAQFYHYDLSGNLAEACGDRSVVIIDARLRKATVGEIAAEECEKRGLQRLGHLQRPQLYDERPGQ